MYHLSNSNIHQLPIENTNNVFEIIINYYTV